MLTDVLEECLLLQTGWLFWAVPLNQVREVAVGKTILAIPGQAGSGYAGVIEWQGRLIPVLNPELCWQRVNLREGAKKISKEESAGAEQKQPAATALPASVQKVDTGAMAARRQLLFWQAGQLTCAFILSQNPIFYEEEKLLLQQEGSCQYLNWQDQRFLLVTNDVVKDWLCEQTK